MSSAERHQLHLKRVREEFRVHEADCGSCQVQGEGPDAQTVDGVFWCSVAMNAYMLLGSGYFDRKD